MPDCGSCGGLEELWQSDQIVTRLRQGELEAEFSDSPEHGPRKPADRLAPAEWLLDALSLLLAHGIAGMSRGARVDGGAPSADVLGDVRRHVEGAHVGDERSRIVTLVGAQSDAAGAGRMAHDHLFRRHP